MSKLKRTALRIFAHTLLPSAKRVFVVLALSLLVSPLFFLTRGSTPVYAATSDTLNFQARLQNAAGSIAPDGYYNIQFKLYDAASGGTNLWTESYTYNSGSGSCTGPLGGNDCRVRVVNGYISVNLGESTAFGSLAWDQQMYLTMNIGGTVTSGSFPTMGDGEMSPRLKLTAVPYAFQAKQAESLSQIQGSYTGTLSFGTLTGGNQNFVLPDQGAGGTYNLLTTTAANANYIQNGTGVQTANFNIQSAAAGSVAAVIQGASGQSTDFLQVKDSSNNKLLYINSSGNTFFGGDIVSSTTGVIRTLDRTVAGDSVSFTIRSGNTTSGNTGSFTLKSGDATGGNSGSISLDVGTASGGTVGTITVGGTNATSITVGNSSSTTTVAGAATFNGNATFTNTSGVAYNKGTDFSTTGPSDDVNFGTGVLFRLTGASTQTIRGIQGGTDGRTITLLNAGSGPAVLANEAGTSTAAYRITTGTGASLNIPVGGSIQLIYDSADSRWRVIGVTDAGANYVQLQGSTPGSAQTGNFNISGTGIADILQGTSHVYTADLDTVSTSALTIGGTNATSLTLGNTTNTTAIALQGAAAATYTIGNSNTTGTITLGQSTATNTISIGAAAGASATQTINIGTSSTASSTTNVNIGSTVAGTITLNSNTVLSAGKSITLIGGNTASRPGSPTAGMLYYDTDTNQLLTYNGSKWQADRSTTTKIVAASNSPQAVKDAADYVADGTSDESEINSALTAAAGGTVYLAEGTFVAGGTILVPNNTILAGAGNGTTIELADLDATDNLIENKDSTAGNATPGSGVVIRDLKLDGRNDLNTAGTQYGIYFSDMGSGTGATAVQGSTITNLRVTRFRNDGVYLTASSNNTITNSNFRNNGAVGMSINASSDLNVISNNRFQGNGAEGFVLSSSSYNNITNNNSEANTTLGMNFTSGGSRNTISGNNVSNNGTSGIRLSGETRSSIVGNTIRGGGGSNYGMYLLNSTNNNAFSSNNIYDTGSAGNTNGFFLDVASYNNIANNVIGDSSCTTACYAININNAGATNNFIASNNIDSGASIRDTGTGTIYGGQNSGTAFLIQPGIDMTLGGASTTTTIQGNTAVTLSGTTGTTQVCQNGSGYLSACDASYLAPTASNFIQNQNSSDQTANFRISGTAQANTSVLTPLLDTASAVALNIGTTNATQINLNKNVSIAANQNITFAAGTGNFDQSSSSGTFATGTGTVSLNGDTTVASGKNLTVTSGTTSLTGTTNINTSGTGATSIGSNSGGAVTVAANAASSFTTNTGALTLTSAAATTWSTTAGSLTLQGAAGVTLTSAAGTASSDVTLSTGNASAGASGNISIDTGTATTTTGTVSIGTTNASAISIGHTGVATTIQGNLVIANTGYFAYNKGTDYSTTGTSNNVNFGTGSLYRLTGASAQTITGIAGGVDGRIITLINAGSATAIIANLSGSSDADKQISTGTGANISVQVGSAISMVYDSTASLWRVIGDAAGGGGGGATVALDNLSGVAINTSLLPGTTNTIDLGDGTHTWRYGYFGTAVYGPEFDTASAVALNIGTTNATVINLNENTTVAVGKTIRVVGDTYANISGYTPAAGMITYDTTNNQLLTYNGTKWVADGKEAILVAASNSSQADKNAADYVADGTADDVEIQAALDSADPASGSRKTGKVYLFAGTYNISTNVTIKNNTTIAGAGRGTLLSLISTTSAVKVLTNFDTSTGEGVSIQNLRIDGNNGTVGAQYGIYLDGMGGGTGASARQGAKVNNVILTNFNTANMYLSSSYHGTFSGITSQASDGDGIGMTGSGYNVFTGNTVQGNTGDGFDIANSNTITITGNTIQNNSAAGISTSSSPSVLTITGNTIRNNSVNGITFAQTTYSTVSGNNIYNNTGDGINTNINTTSNTYSGNNFYNNSGDGIEIAASFNTVTGNTFISNANAVLVSGGGNEISGNTMRSNSAAGVSLNGASADNNTVSGNIISANTSYGVYLAGADNNNIVGNRIYDNGGLTTNNGIYLTNSDSNSIQSNALTDGNASSNDYAINIFDGTSNSNTLSDNTIGTSATINDSGTGTIYGGQNNGTSYLIQPAQNLTIGSASTTTTIQGNTGVTLNATTGTTMVCQNGSGYLSTCDATYLAPTATNFIQNQNSSDQTANFRISGTAQANTSVLTPLLDTASAVALNIGTTNATVINLNENTTVATGKTLRVVGDTYANISGYGSPSAGTITYDTTNNQTLTYNGTKWKADSTDAVLVAASDSSQADKNAADYVADGTNDESEINTALTAASSSGTRKTGKVYLFAGTYTVTGSGSSVISVPDGVTLAGAGYGTLIQLGNVAGSTRYVITNSNTTNGTGVVVRDLRVDGAKSTNTSGTQYGIYFNGMGNSGSGIEGGTIQNTWVTNVRTQGIYLNNSNYSQVVNNAVYANASGGGTTAGITVNGTRNTIINNNVHDNGNYGIALSGVLYSVINSNQLHNNTSHALDLSGNSSANTINSNNFRNNGGATTTDAIYLSSSTSNTITSNVFSDANCSTTCYAINISDSGSTGTYIADNSFGVFAGSAPYIYAASGSNPTYGGQLNIAGAGAYTIQNAGAIALATGDSTSTANITLTTGNASAGNSGNISFDTGTASGTTGTISIGGTNASAVTIGRAAATTNVASNTTYFGTSGGSIVVQAAAQTTASTTGNTLTIKGGTGGSGNANGGTLALSGGDATGTGVKGLITIDPAAFTTAATQNCTSDCNITQSNIDSKSAVLLTTDVAGHTVTLTDPTILTAGRILYVTNYGSYDFTLSVNGGGTGNTIAMKPATTATMIWNGLDWTAAGASSSTDLQSAYNNTLTSAGGAELVLNASGGAADGLTIRNNGTSPISGGLLEVQSNIGTNLFSVNNYGTELAANGGAETAGGSSTTFPSNTWGDQGSGTATRTVTSGEYQTGQAGVKIATTASSSDGAKNQLTANPVASTTYTVSFTAASSTAGQGTTPIEVIYSPDNGTTLTNICQGYGDGFTTSRTISNYTNYNWTKVTCTVTTTAASVTTPLLIIRQTDATSRTIYVDNLSFIRNDSTTRPSNVQIGGGVTGGQVTLFTFDRASSAPLVSGSDDRYLGSMYYDTTLGNIQCYEADGWGACGSAPDNIVTLTPEYSNAVLGAPGTLAGTSTATGVGTLTADFCSNESGVLQVNTSFCATHISRNYYRWTSPQPTAQTYSIYVNYKLPSTFKEFYDDNTIKLSGFRDSATDANANLKLSVFRSNGSAITQCGSTTQITSSSGSWETTSLGGTGETSCGFQAGEYIVFKIDVTASNNYNVYVENLEFRYTNK